MRSRFGFTFIELLIVLGIMAIILVVSVPFFSTSISSNDLQTSTWQVVNDLRRAQAASMTAQSNSPWGVHFQADRHVIFRGTSYSPVDPDNIETVLPGTLTISGISLNGAGSDVRFIKISGTTTDFGTITLQDTNTGTTSTVSINAAGRIQ